jgi:hypothetical protein
MIRDRKVRFFTSGAIAGAISAFSFAVIHHLFISDIWFSLGVMLAAGALCGLCVGWSYALLVEIHSIRNWLRYNLLYVTILALLGLTSVLVFEPVTTIAALAGGREAADVLIRQAFPLTALFTLGAAVLITWLYGPSWARFGAILLTLTLIVLLLGLNISLIGLIEIPRSSLYLVAELFLLVIAINGVYAAAFIFFERPRLPGSQPI